MMDSPRQVLHRVRSWFPNSKMDHELDAEIESHLEFATEENRKRGMAAAEARRQALSICRSRPEQGETSPGARVADARHPANLRLHVSHLAS